MKRHLIGAMCLETMGVPETGRHLVNTLQKSAPHNESERASTR